MPKINKQFQHALTIPTRGPGLYEFTDKVVSWVGDSSLSMGLLTLFCRHTSASLTIQENADADVQHDLNNFFRRLVAEDASLYRHRAEGADDMPAHIKSALTDVSLSIPVADGAPTLGTWQGIYLFEHRAHAHNRIVVMHLTGD